MTYSYEEYLNFSDMPLNEEELKRLRQMYIESFPPEERRPWEQLLGKMNEAFALRLLRYRGCPCGFLSLWRLRHAVFVEHFVISPAVRGQGVGSAAMKSLLTEPRDCPLILEIEPRELSPEARRRQEFYERLGLTLLPYPYIQPPYIAGTMGVRLRLMSCHPLPETQIQPIIDELHRVVYRTNAPTHVSIQI